MTPAKDLDLSTSQMQPYEKCPYITIMRAMLPNNVMNRKLIKKPPNPDWWEKLPTGLSGNDADAAIYGIGRSGRSCKSLSALEN